MFYICPICGKVIYIQDGDTQSVVCCGKEMIRLVANLEDASLEKHVPYCEIHDGMIDVTVGEVLHPMTEEHYIEWIAMVVSGEAIIQRLKPGDSPKASFPYQSGASVYAYCNLHSLWKRDI